MDDIGGPHSHANYPWGWAQAGNTPFKWYKQNTHEGGVHVPLIVHWPDADHRRRRRPRPVPPRQRHRPHRLRPPRHQRARGLPGLRAAAGQRAVHALHLRRSRTRRRPSGRSTTRCSATGRSSPTDGRRSPVTPPGVPFDDDAWELYHYDVDRSECHDLAAAMLLLHSLHIPKISRMWRCHLESVTLLDCFG